MYTNTFLLLQPPGSIMELGKLIFSDWKKDFTWSFGSVKISNIGETNFHDILSVKKKL